MEQADLPLFSPSFLLRASPPMGLSLSCISFPIPPSPQHDLQLCKQSCTASKPSSHQQSNKDNHIDSFLNYVHNLTRKLKQSTYILIIYLYSSKTSHWLSDNKSRSYEVPSNSQKEASVRFKTKYCMEKSLSIDHENIMTKPLHNTVLHVLYLNTTISKNGSSPHFPTFMR